MRQRAVADIPESMLSDIRRHPPPRPPGGRLTRSKIKKPPLAVKKSNSGPIPTFPKGKEIDNHAIGHGDIDSCKITTSTKCNGLLRVTPAANRNSYRVAISFYVLTQGRGASPLNPGLGKRNSYRVAAADGLSNGSYLELYIVDGMYSGDFITFPRRTSPRR